MIRPYAVAWNAHNAHQALLIRRPEDFASYNFSDVVWLRSPNDSSYDGDQFRSVASNALRQSGGEQWQAVPMPPPNHMFDEKTWVSELSTIPYISPEEGVMGFGGNAYFVETLHLKHTFSAADYPKARQMFRAIAPKAAEASGRVPLADWMAAHVRFLSVDDAAKVLAACVARRMEAGV